MADPSSSVTGMNAFIASWFTPSSLFLLLNLVIGTIVLSSRFGGQRRRQQHYQIGTDGTPVQLARTPSLLERVKSINLSLYKFEPKNPEQEFHQDHQPVESNYVPSYPYPEHSTQLARAPSLLDRLKSMNFQSLYRSDSTSDEKGYHQTVESESGTGHPNPSEDSSTPLARTPSLLQRLKSINFQSLYRSDSTRYDKEPHQPVESDYVHPYPSVDSSTTLSWAPPLLERLKSMNFQSLYRSDSTSSEKGHHQPTELGFPEGNNTNPDHYSSRGHINSVKRSESERGGKTGGKSSEKMQRSVSEKPAAGTSSGDDDVEDTESRWPPTEKTASRSDTTSLLDDEDCVNAKADDFIKRFRQQLRLQRLDSLLAYRTAKGN